MESLEFAMDTDSAILKNYENHFKKIDEELARFLSSRVDLIINVEKHILLGRAKKLRPLFFVLSCHLCNYREESIYRFSTLFEYIHAASLLHDDVLDNAEVRRNKPSANQIWGNQTAVLGGDFLVSKFFSLAVSSNNMMFLRRLTDTIQMTEGQILELLHADDWDISKEEYMEIIRSKTAVLISIACACGAILSGAGEAAEKSLSEFGLNVGIAFQLMDDLLDYTSSKEVFGKPVGKDLREGKITLPLIYTLPKLDRPERKRLEDLFVNHQATDEDYEYLIGLVRSSGAVDEIRNEAQSYVDKAGTCLSLFPESPAKRDLLELSQYVIDRIY